MRSIQDKFLRYLNRPHHMGLVIELPESGRAAFLERVCGDDREMLEQLQSLVACHFGAAKDFLESSPVLESQRNYLGREVGPYKLLAQIGKGGMADVYLASRSDGVFKNNVALKLVKLSIHNEELITRLHRERLILSDLKHPNIANLLDGEQRQVLYFSGLQF
jgi:serine/threonine protein kinase